jgi:hypothetical protein
MLSSVLMLLMAAASSASIIYKAACTGASTVPAVNTKATGSVSITLVNTSYAAGYFYATNIKQMTMAHIHVGALGKNGPSIAWAFNATYGPISGSVKASFTFNPSQNNISALLAAGLIYFNVHTKAYPAGELRGQLTGPGNVTYPSPPPQKLNNNHSLMGSYLDSYPTPGGRSYGQDGTPDPSIIQKNDQTCCGGDGGSPFDWWNSCQV